MATDTFWRVEQGDQGRFFRKVLRIDGVITTLLGIITLIESAWLPAIMGTGTTPIYLGFGAACTALGVLLFWLSRRAVGRRTMLAVLALAVFVFIDGLMLLFGPWVTFSPIGFSITLAITDVVGVIALAYFIGLRRAGG